MGHEPLSPDSRYVRTTDLTAILFPRWREAWKEKRFRNESALSFLLLAGVLVLLTHFLQFVETRHGVVLSDPVLAIVQPRDLSWLTFSCIYAGLLLAIGVLSLHPRLLVFAVQAYAAMVLLRIGAMYLLPVDPPVGMIPLNDPFVQYFGTGRVLTRDLFFSGHTATLFLLALVVPGKWMKGIFFGLTVAVALCVVIQHVHYGIDVYIAPIAAYASYRAAKAISEAGGIRDQSK